MRFQVWLMAFLISLLAVQSGCSSKRRTKKDGAPRHVPANLLRIPNAKPKVEPLSKWGNRYGGTNSYVTFNKRYHVLSSSRGYRERGIASWYGTQFHGRTTSNGETYNMFAMTAAHKTLPLPTYVKVTNLRNKKSVVVKVNDRGPFHDNRIIDLSYAAAAKLGMLGKGTAQVEVESVDPRDNGNHRRRSTRSVPNKRTSTNKHIAPTKPRPPKKIPTQRAPRARNKTTHSKPIQSSVPVERRK